MQQQGFKHRIKSLSIGKQKLHQLSFHGNLQDLHISLMEVSIESLCFDVPA